MRVVLLRHGIAVDHDDPACPADEERPLTPEGERRTRKAARGLAALEVAPVVVLSSPLVRALQTAEIAAEELDCDDVRITEALRGGIHTAETFRVLEEIGAETIICVGHAPHLDLVLAQSLGSGHANLRKIKKAGAAMIEFDRIGKQLGLLSWQMQPKALRALAQV